MPIVVPDLVNEMRAAEFDLAAAGDLVGAHMMGDVINGYIAGSVAEGNARAAVEGTRKRLSRDVPS